MEVKSDPSIVFGTDPDMATPIITFIETTPTQTKATDQGLLCNKFLLMANSNASKISMMCEQIFDTVECKKALSAIGDSLDKFYENIIENLSQKKCNTEREVNELFDEAVKLKCDLKVDIELPLLGNSIPLMRQKAELKKCLSEMSEILHQRELVIANLMSQQMNLCQEMGIDVLQHSPIPTQDEIARFDSYIRELQVECEERRYEFLNLQTSVIEKMRALGISQDIISTVEGDDRKLTVDLITDFRTKNAELTTQLDQLTQRIDIIREKIKRLYLRITDLTDDHKQEILGLTDYTQTNCVALEAELQTCEQLRHDNLHDYIKQVRDDIKMMLEKTLAPEEDRCDLTSSYDDSEAEDVMESSETKLELLQLYYNENKEIFDLWEERSEVWSRINALNVQANNSGRLHNRGAQLLNEERERKTLVTKLLKLEHNITVLTEAYEERENDVFKVYGKNIQLIMVEDWKNNAKAKEILAIARKHVQTPKLNDPGRVVAPRRTAPLTPVVPLARVPNESQPKMSGIVKPKYFNTYPYEPPLGPRTESSVRVVIANSTSDVNLTNGATERILERLNLARDADKTKSDHSLKPRNQQ